MHSSILLPGLVSDNPEVAARPTDTLASADQRASLRGGSAPAGSGSTPVDQRNVAARALALQGHPTRLGF